MSSFIAYDFSSYWYCDAASLFSSEQVFVYCTQFFVLLVWFDCWFYHSSALRYSRDSSSPNAFLEHTTPAAISWPCDAAFLFFLHSTPPPSSHRYATVTNFMVHISRLRVFRCRPKRCRWPWSTERARWQFCCRLVTYHQNCDVLQASFNTGRTLGACCSFAPVL